MAESKELTPVEEAAPLSLLTGSPDNRLTEAAAVANALAPLISQKKLYATISGRKHVLYEGWTTLGALMGVFPVTAWTRPVDDGWEARVEARTLDGSIVGAAEAQCLRAESNWKSRDDFALRSMAQTRAGSKALRMPLGFIMSLAGYEATPAEEMPSPSRSSRQPAKKSPPSGQDEDGAGALMGQAKVQWPDREAHTAACQALNLPEIREGAIREHWLGKGGTYAQAKAYIAEVRRLETGGMDLEAAIEKVDAFGKLTPEGQQALPDRGE